MSEKNNTEPSDLKKNKQGQKFHNPPMQNHKPVPIPYLKVNKKRREKGDRKNINLVSHPAVKQRRALSVPEWVTAWEYRVLLTFFSFFSTRTTFSTRITFSYQMDDFCEKFWTVVNGHTTLKTPVLVRSPQLSSVGPCQYLDGWPPGNTGCCWHFFQQGSHFHTKWMTSVKNSEQSSTAIPRWKHRFSSDPRS